MLAIKQTKVPWHPVAELGRLYEGGKVITVGRQSKTLSVWGLGLVTRADASTNYAENRGAL